MKKFVKKAFLPFLISTIALTTGCSSSSDPEDFTTQDQEPTAVINLKGHTKDQRVGTRDLTLDYIPNTRYGAAINEGSYKHTLDQVDIKQSDSPMLSKHVKFDRELMYETDGVAFTPLEINELDDNDLLIGNRDQFKAVGAHGNPYYPILEDFGCGSTQDYSIYNLSRWERFCNYGLGMDKRDWKFVKEHKNEFPKELKEKCNPPDYQRLKAHGLISDHDSMIRQAYGKSIK